MKAFFKLFPLIENKSDSSTLKFNLSHCRLEYLTPCQRDKIPGSLCRAEYTKSFSGSWSRLMLRCLLTKPTWPLEVCSLCIAWAQKALPRAEELGAPRPRAWPLDICHCRHSLHPHCLLWELPHYLGDCQTDVLPRLWAISLLLDFSS